MFSLSSVILFKYARTCVFLIFTTRVDLKTRLNGVKFSLNNVESFSLRFLFEKSRFPGDPQKHLGNSARYPPLPAELNLTEGKKNVLFIAVRASRQVPGGACVYYGADFFVLPGCQSINSQKPTSLLHLCCKVTILTFQNFYLVRQL